MSKQSSNSKPRNTYRMFVDACESHRIERGGPEVQPEIEYLLIVIINSQLSWDISKFL